MHASSSDVSYYFVLFRHKQPTTLIEVSPCASTNITDNSIGVKENLIAVRSDVHVLLAFNTAPLLAV